MNYFIAETPEQLDICLRLLYAEDIGFTVEISDINKKRAVYYIKAEGDNQKINQILETYRILIS